MVWSYPGALFLAAGGYHHHLGTNTWAGAVPPRAADEAGLLSWDLIVPTDTDVNDVVASARSAGADVSRQQQGWDVADPWGTVVRVSAGAT